MAQLCKFPKAVDLAGKGHHPEPVLFKVNVFKKNIYRGNTILALPGTYNFFRAPSHFRPWSLRGAFERRKDDSSCNYFFLKEVGKQGRYPPAASSLTPYVRIPRSGSPYFDKRPEHFAERGVRSTKLM